MEKRLPVILGGNLSAHKKQRVDVKCMGRNLNEYVDCKVKHSPQKPDFDTKENLKCEEENKQLEDDRQQRGSRENWSRSLHGTENSQGFEDEYYPLDDPLSDTDFRDVKVLMAMKSASRDFIYYITFEAFSAHGVAVTFQTKICDLLPHPYSKIEIMLVNNKSSETDHNKFKNSQEGQPSEFDHKCQIYEQRLSQVIKTYTTDSQYNVALYLSQYALVSCNNFYTDSRYNVALYLSQYALVTYNFHTLKVPDAVHDIQSLKVVKPMKPVADGTTYLITFKASLRDKSKTVETFETEIRIPTLFPTTMIEFKTVRIKPN